jgi:hypothetical protein
MLSDEDDSDGSVDDSGVLAQIGAVLSDSDGEETEQALMQAEAKDVSPSTQLIKHRLSSKK